MLQGRSQSMTVWSYPEKTFCRQVIPSSSIRAFLASLCKTSGGRHTQRQAAEPPQCLSGSSLATPLCLLQCINEVRHFTLSNDWSPVKINPGILPWNLCFLKQTYRSSFSTLCYFSSDFLAMFKQVADEMAISSCFSDGEEDPNSVMKPAVHKVTSSAVTLWLW